MRVWEEHLPRAQSSSILSQASIGVRHLIILKQCLLLFSASYSPQCITQASMIGGEVWPVQVLWDADMPSGFSFLLGRDFGSIGSRNAVGSPRKINSRR